MFSSQLLFIYFWQTKIEADFKLDKIGKKAAYSLSDLIIKNRHMSSPTLRN